MPDSPRPPGRPFGSGQGRKRGELVQVWLSVDEMTRLKDFVTLHPSVSASEIIREGITLALDQRADAAADALTDDYRQRLETHRRAIAVDGGPSIDSH